MSKNSPDRRRARLRLRSHHRGTKELDYVLGRFADAYLDTFDEAALASYDALLDEPDLLLWSWVTGQTMPAADKRTPVLEQLLRWVGVMPMPGDHPP